MALSGYDKYNQEMEEFEKGPLYNTKYALLIDTLIKKCLGVNNSKDNKYFCDLLEFNEPGKKAHDGSKLRDLVKHARRKGVPIGSNGTGYFYARNKEEYEQSIQHMLERKNSLEFTTLKMRGASFKDIDDMFNKLF